MSATYQAVNGENIISAAENGVSGGEGRKRNGGNGRSWLESLTAMGENIGVSSE